MYYYIIYKYTSSGWLICLSTAADIYMKHGLPDVMLQSTQHEVILNGLRVVTSERQVISHDTSITPMILMVQNGRKRITYIYYVIKQLLTYVSVDIESY